MGTKDRAKQRAASKRYREKLREKKYGPNAPDQRGRHRNHAKGPRHPSWSDGRMISDHGYVKVRVGVDHPLADPNGYAYEHAVVWTSAGNPRPSPDELIHHENGIKTDNRLGNLRLMKRGRHSAIHAPERDECGRFS